VVPLATAYLQVTALGLAATTLADTVDAAFVGHGDSRASLYMNVVAVGGTSSSTRSSSSAGGPSRRWE
jgi:Na+-driven multidrug efflux pump